MTVAAASLSPPCARPETGGGSRERVTDTPMAPESAQSEYALALGSQKQSR